MELFLSELCEKGYLCAFDEIRQNWTKKVYDASFEYRFFYLLRHFMQHNHLSVGVYSETKGEIRCCLDLSQLTNTPHFNMKKSINEELKRLTEEMAQGPQKHSRLAYTIAMAKFNVIVLKLYCEFFEVIDEAIKKVCDACNNFISSN